MSASISAQGPSFCPIVAEIAAFFPELEGYVVEVKGDMIFLDLGKPSGVMKGMEFLCIREGEEFTHPITGDVLGRFEDKLGFVQITEINENYSIGKILQNFSGKVIKRGDKIRITTARIPIALLPDLPMNPNIQALVKGLKQSGRFTIIPSSSVVPVLKEMGLSSFDSLTPVQTRKISEKLDISAIIILSVENLDQKDIIHAQIISAHTGVLMTRISHECGERSETLLSQSAPITSKILPDSQGSSDRFRVPLQEGITGISHLSQTLSLSIRHMAIGDVTGNGRDEICITDGQNIMLYIWQEQGLEQIAEVKGKTSEDHLSLDIADINGNGCAEIFVSNLEMDSLHSFVMEWQKDRLKKIWEKVPLFLKVMSVYPKEKMLLGQGMGITKPFDSQISEYEWKKDTFVPKGEIEFPSMVNIFNLGKADLDGDGIEELVFLDKRLRIYRNGEKIWESDSEYGGKTVFFEHKAKGALVLSEGETRVYLSSHLNIQDMNGNGKPDIMLIKNVSSTGSLFPKSRFYRKGEVCIIEWNGISFSEVWCSGQIDAYLTDIGIGDINSDNKDDLILSMVLVSGIGKFWKTSPSKILFY